jgi:hypothetical protein
MDPDVLPRSRADVPTGAESEANSATPRTWRAVPWGPLISIALAAVSTGYFYRGFFGSGFQLFQGDNQDGRLTAWISSHWWNPFLFSDNWRDLGIFFPIPSTLGFSDTFLITGVLSAPLGWMGFSSSVGFQWALIFVSLTGYVSAVVLFRVGPRASWPIANLGAFSLVFANGLIAGSSHPQLILWQWAPLVVLLLLWAARAHTRLGKFGWGLSAGVVIGALTYSAFLVGWLLVIGLALIFLLCLPLIWARGLLLGFVRRLWIVAASLALGIVSWVPALIATYLWVLQQTGGRSLESVMLFALDPREIFNITDTNLLWGRAVPSLVGEGNISSASEVSFQPTYVLILAGVAVVIAVGRRLRVTGPWQLLAFSSALAGLITLWWPVNFGDLFIWELTSQLPGSSATRAIGRVNLLSASLLCFGVFVCLAVWRQATRSRIEIAVILSVAALIAFEQVNSVIMQRHDSRRIDDLAAIGPPPSECSSFLVTKGKLPAEFFPLVQVDAGLVARMHAVPTWNGYSGAEPSGYGLQVWDSPMYWADAGYWRDSFGLADPCGLDLEQGVWVSAEITGARIEEARSAWLSGKGL